MGSSSNRYLRQSSRLTLAVEHLGYIRPNARDCVASLSVRLLFFLWDFNAFSFVACKKTQQSNKAARLCRGRCTYLFVEDAAV